MNDPSLFYKGKQLRYKETGAESLLLNLDSIIIYHLDVIRGSVG